MGSTKRLKVAVVHESMVEREGLRAVLARIGAEVTALAASADELARALVEEPPDVVLADVRAADQIERDDLGVLAISDRLDVELALSLLDRRCRGLGYLLKDSVGRLDELRDALETVAAGACFVDPAVVSAVMGNGGMRALASLTHRERDILALMAEGRSNSAICGRLYVSPKTVEAHVRNIFSKLDLVPAEDDHRRVLAVLHYLGRATP